MVHTIIIGVVAVAAIVLAVGVYGKVVSTYMGEHASAIGKDAQLQASTGLSWLGVKIQGWKTHILAAVAAPMGLFAALPPSTLQDIISLPTSIMVADQKVAAWISTVLVALIPIFHAQGLAQAANAQPQDRSDGD